MYFKDHPNKKGGNNILIDLFFYSVDDEKLIAAGEVWVKVSFGKKKIGVVF